MISFYSSYRQTDTIRGDKEYFYRELQPYPKGDFAHIWLIKLNLIKGFNPYTPSGD